MGQVQQTWRPMDAGLLKWSAVTRDRNPRLHPDNNVGTGDQASALLNGLPSADSEYAPKQPITLKLKTLISDHAYTRAFEEAISGVQQKRRPDFAQIRTLNHFYFLIDALVTWIPELRTWGWDGETFHERTNDPRITQFYVYFNQPQLLALQSAIEPQSTGSLTPLSLPAGMAQVSAIVFVKPGGKELIRLSEEEQDHLSYDKQVERVNARIQAEVVGRRVSKGEMMTSFLFGGSDLLMLFERQSRIHVTASVGTHYPVRGQLATANIVALLAEPQPPAAHTPPLKIAAWPAAAPPTRQGWRRPGPQSAPGPG